MLHQHSNYNSNSGTEKSSDHYYTEPPVIVMPPGSAPIPVGIAGKAAYQTIPNEKSFIQNASEQDSTANTNSRELSDFLLRHLGKCLRISLKSESDHAEQMGTLLEIGNSYLILQEFASQNLFLCDLSAIRYIHIYHEPEAEAPRSLFGI